MKLGGGKKSINRYELTIENSLKIIRFFCAVKFDARLNAAAKRSTGDMQINPDIGSLSCLSAHFRVTIRVLLITHKAPGNLSSLTFLPGAPMQGPLRRKAR